MLLDESTAARGFHELRALRSALRALERSLVIEARRQGASWAEVGERLGMRPQSAWERFRSIDPRPARARTIDDDVRDFHTAWLEEDRRT